MASVQPRFARVAAAIGDPTRALMLARLLDGRHYTAKELAEQGGVVPATASQHLKLLVDERLLRVRAQGRHRYFTLADGNVAQALEALLRVADGALPETARWQAPAMRGLRRARSCYGHLAGELGVREAALLAACSRLELYAAADDPEKILARARAWFSARAGAEVVLMTEKDAVKCAAIADSRMWFLRVEAILPPEFDAFLLARVAGARGPQQRT